MIVKIKNNYLLRNRKAFLYYLSKILFGQIIAIFLFLAVSCFSINRQINVKTVLYSLSIIILFLIFYFYFIHKKDLTKTTYHFWPLDTTAEYASYLQILYNKNKIMQLRTEKLIHETENQLVALLSLRKRAMALRNNQILKDISKNYKEILEIRAEANDVAKNLLVHQKGISELVNIFATGNSTEKTLENIRLYQNKLSREKSSLFMIQRKDVKITNFIELTLEFYKKS
jgi:hypothetical protein